MYRSGGKYSRYWVLLGPMLFHCASSLAECTPKITAVPLSDEHLAVVGRCIPPSNFVRFRYSLTPEDQLEIYSRENAGPTRVSDRGIALRHKGIAQLIPISELAVMHGQDSYFRNNFTALSLTRVCASATPVFYLAFGYQGDMTSANLFLAIVPTAAGYRATALPMVSGGILDVSRQTPLTVKTWDNLFEGECNACETHYRVREYVLVSGTPVRKRSFVPRHLYTSQNFDDRLRVRLVP
jgi:hypothetical protein